MSMLRRELSSSCHAVLNWCRKRSWINVKLSKTKYHYFLNTVNFPSRNAREWMDPQLHLRVAGWLIEIWRPVKQRSGSCAWCKRITHHGVAKLVLFERWNKRLPVHVNRIFGQVDKETEEIYLRGCCWWFAADTPLFWEFIGLQTSLGSFLSHRPSLYL